MVLSSKFDRAVFTFALRYAMPRNTYALSVVVDELEKQAKVFTDLELLQFIEESESCLDSYREILHDCDVDQHNRLQLICSRELKERKHSLSTKE